jgi:FkbM family methyltransferase
MIEAINSKDGRIYWVDSGDKLYIQRLKIGQYQRGNWHFAQTLIDNWHRAIDVGSNNACNAIHYADKFQTVECFEPTQLAQQLWLNTVRDNAVTNCQLHAYGLGERDYSTEILIHEHNGGHNHLMHYDKNPRARPERRRRDTESVEVKTLDSYQFTDVGFIKIDVEGYEKFVLEGAQITIKNNRPTIQLEIVGNQCRKFNYRAEDMIQWIRSWNYAVLSRHRGVLQGEFTTVGNDLLYNGAKMRGEMDLWFQPVERLRTSPREEIFQDLFEACH